MVLIFFLIVYNCIADKDNVAFQWCFAAFKNQFTATANRYTKPSIDVASCQSAMTLFMPLVRKFYCLMYNISSKQFPILLQLFSLCNIYWCVLFKFQFVTKFWTLMIYFMMAVCVWLTIMFIKCYVYFFLVYICHLIIFIW